MSDRRRIAAVAVLLLVTLASAACQRAGPVPPATHPVSGKAVGQGGASLAGGVVQFQSQQDSQLIALGDIQADGSFTLYTPFHGRQLPGAVEGPQQVTVIPPMTERQDAVPTTLLETYTVTKQGSHFEILFTTDGTSGGGRRR